MMRRRSLAIPAVTVALGVCTIFVGSLVRGDYAQQVWQNIGAALVLFGPLYWVQSMLERGLREVRQQEQHTRSSVEQLSHEIEAIRQQTTASLLNRNSAARPLSLAKRRRPGSLPTRRTYRITSG